nr:DNA-3-methyladenine glycosylase I [Candidatus Sumerlaeota bacterium]
MIPETPVPTAQTRCPWCLSHPLYIRYHDTEWGVPQHDDRRLFEMLILEGAQAGLSWLTILKRREEYEKAYFHWDIERIARFDDTDRKRLLLDSGIIRNRSKVEASIRNAQCFLNVCEEFGSFDTYLWRFTENRVLCASPRFQRVQDLPCVSAESQRLSKDLQQRGFRFVGPTILYSYLQACGLVDDHLQDCFKSNG